MENDNLEIKLDKQNALLVVNLPTNEQRPFYIAFMPLYEMKKPHSERTVSLSAFDKHSQNGKLEFGMHITGLYSQCKDCSWVFTGMAEHTELLPRHIDTHSIEGNAFNLLLQKSIELMPYNNS